MAPNDDNVIIEPTPFTKAESTATRERFRLRPIPAVLAIVFLALAVFAAFMFSARAVRFNIDPAPDTFAIVDGLHYRLGERYVMLPGTYRIVARREGYHDLATEVEVGEAQDQDFGFTLEKLPGILTITTDPPAAGDVFVDQVRVGVTPLTLDEIPAGLHDISIATERYLPYDTEIDIEGKRVEQSIEAGLVPAWGNVSIDSLPDDAVVEVDGHPVGNTPATVEVLRGKRKLQLVKPGYKVWQTTLDVAPGEDILLDTVRLERSDGTVSIVTEPAGANVTIGDRYRGQTPLDVKLAPGATYPVLISRAGYEPVERSITVRPEEDIALNTKLQPVLGVVRLLVEPEGGELLVDGRSMGAPAQRLELTAKSHDIEIRKEGYATWKGTITPTPGLAQQLMIQLQTEEEAMVAAINERIGSDVGLEFKLIIPDRLHMGAGRREPGRRSNEIEKDVQLTRPYYLSVHEVTNKQYGMYDPSHDSGILGRALLSEANRPVVNVRWEDAVQFCNWLSKRDGLAPAYEFREGRWQGVSPMNTGYRLPTEAEWAWAARYAAGPEPTRFPWGNAMPPTSPIANFADESARSMVPYHIDGYNDSFRGPAPVGSFPPNEFGIYDLAGNASEWVHDYYSIALVSETLVDPMGPDEGQYHVIRGSNYTHGRFSELRWTFRDYGDSPRPDVGFRVARYVE